MGEVQKDVKTIYDDWATYKKKQDGHVKDATKKLDDVMTKLQAEIRSRFNQLPMDFLPTVLETEQLQAHVARIIRPNLDEFRQEVNQRLEKFAVRQDKMRTVGYKEILTRSNERHQDWVDHS